jgi:hypothetical protein
MPPKAPADVVAAMRAAFTEMWNDKTFLADYTRVLAIQPVMVPGDECQTILTDLAKVPRPIKDFLVNYTNHITEK